MVIPIVNENSKRRPFSKSNLRRIFLLEKLSNPFGYAFLFLLGTAIAFGIAKMGLVFGILAMLVFIALPVVYVFVAFPKIGITLHISFAYFIMFFLRMGVKFPLGTMMDGLEFLLLLSFMISIKKHRDVHLVKGPISTLIIIWIVYNLLEVANPTAESRAAWVYTVRSVAVVMLMYFIFVYNIRTKQFIRFILKLWLFLALIGALYAVKQEKIGFFQFENDYLNSDPAIGLLLFIGGTWRKFSIFNDPVVFAYTMVVSALLCIGLMTGPISKKKKWILAILAVIYINSMLYSGTRGAYVLIPAALILYGILKYNKYVLYMAMLGGVMFMVLINISTSNQTLYRFQSAFKPSEDASYTVRKNNQKRIQPYILSHPMGGGLGATGEWGRRFAPHSFLASFPPDSGYVRVVVELGWIGLILILMLMFVILKTGINNYYTIRDPELKSYCFAMLMIIYAFHIANFPQEALVQFPSNVYFYLVAALIVVVKRIDDEQNKLLDGK